MRHLRGAFAALSLAAAAACASAGASGSTTGSRQHYSQNVISAEELATIDAPDAYQAIQRLRPQFLVASRGPTELGSRRSGGADGGIMVYLENTRLGGVSALAQIPTNDIKEIRYLSASEATQRYGTGNTSGAIVVTRKPTG